MMLDRFLRIGWGSGKGIYSNKKGIEIKNDGRYGVTAC